MEKNKPIQTVIIDDDKEAIFTLQSFLELMPEVDLKGTASTCSKAIKLIRDTSPELVFLDIEMPGKTGFELLQELSDLNLSGSFKVIFHTGYDKYTLRALREEAFDYLLKPPAEAELKEAIQRFLAHRDQLPGPAIGSRANSTNQMVALPTNKGLQFFPKSEIVYVECQRTAVGLRSSWWVVLNNRQVVKLRPNTNAGSILSHLGSDQFIPLSQSVLVNIAFISMVEYKTHSCFLYPPFDDKPRKISRQYMTALKERFDVI